LRLQGGDIAIERADGNAELLRQRVAAHRPAKPPQRLQKVEEAFGS
jgi:hypothetical protein